MVLLYQKPGKLGAEWAALLWQCREGRGSWFRASPRFPRGEGGEKVGQRRGSMATDGEKPRAQDNVSRRGARH